MQTIQLDRTAALERLLRDVTTQTAVRLTILTEPDLRKWSDDDRPCPAALAHVRKRSRLLGLVCASYGDLVNAQRVREGKAPDFTPMPRKGGGRVGSTSLIQGKDGLLLELVVTAVESARYEALGGPIATEDVEPWIQPSRNSGAHQRLDNPVVYRTVGLHNVVDLEFLVPGDGFTMVRKVPTVPAHAATH